MTSRTGLGRSSSVTLRRAGRIVDAVSAPLQAALKPTRAVGFPYRRPTVPRGVEVPPDPSKLGANFDTDWARRAPARAARAVIAKGPLRLAVRAIANPEVLGLDRLADLQALDEPPAIIFAPNHHSHIDTAIMITAVPEPWTSKMAVAAAAVPGP